MLYNDSHVFPFSCFPLKLHIQSINQLSKKKILDSYLFPHSFLRFMYTFYSRIQSFHALTPAGASVVHKSYSFSTQTLNVVFVVLNSYTVASNPGRQAYPPSLYRPESPNKYVHIKS